MSKRRKTRGYEPHVRLYQYELRCPAYRTLSSDARSLLVEMRALYTGRENRVFMAVREAMGRLNVGQRRAERAIKDLLERGWMRVVEKGSFHRKNRHATAYALTHLPIEDVDGATAPKDYMRWGPTSEKNTVVNLATDGSKNDYRDQAPQVPKSLHGSQNDYRHRNNVPGSVAETATQIVYQGVSAE